MSSSVLKPLAAFDIDGGVPIAVNDPWPALEPSVGYRWLHLDLTDPNTTEWAKAHLPEIAASAICQSETRPRCEQLDDGLILNLRGVNLNPEAVPEDMVSLRMWVTDRTIVSARMRKIWAVDEIRKAA